MEEKLKNMGYREYPKEKGDSELLEKRFQKVFIDEQGIKFFINANKWGEYYNPNTGERKPAGFEYATQFFKKGSSEPMNLFFYNGWAISDVEEYVEKLFNTGLFEYYRRLE